MESDVYMKLRKHLHNLPGGFPETRTGVEIKILKKLFTPEEAELAMALRPVPEDIITIARRLSLSETEITSKMENLARKGLIFRIQEGNALRYMAISYIVGIFEFQLNRIDREFAELHEEYKRYFGRNWLSTKTKQIRIIPIDAAVESVPSVETYNRVRDFVKSQDIIAVMDCICRKKGEIMGRKCDRPRETCLTFGQFARYFIDYGMARQINIEEAMGILNIAEQSALVLCSTNTKKHVAICTCCPCCCGVLSDTKFLPNPAEHIHSSYQAHIDPTLCSKCGTCLGRCQMDAIKEEEDASYTVDYKRCIGCGLCVSSCSDRAATLRPKHGEEQPPKDFFETLRKISRERGLVT